MGMIPPQPPRRPARLTESGEDIDYLMARSPVTAAPASKIRELMTRLDPNYREYRKLSKDPSYRPVKAYSYSEAVRLQLLPPSGTPSSLDLALDSAPTQIEYDSQKTPPQVPSLAASLPRNELPASFEEV